VLDYPAHTSIECLPGSTLPSDMRALGYDVISTGEELRMLASAIVEKYVTTPRASSSR
jgi:hypothetical protein